MFSKGQVLGYLTKEITLRYTNEGVAIGNTSIASNRSYKTKNGGKAEEVLFIDLVIFGKMAEVYNQYLKKGSKVFVEGRIKFDQWQDKNGMNKSKHSIVVERLVMLDTQQQSQNSQNQAMQKQPAKEQQPTIQQVADSYMDVNYQTNLDTYANDMSDDDELPF